ncbi:hypothetical protein HDF24_10795 [Mucilaginibacter sp. X4EP1]|uniref:hypothetical protein n=1 Tax=Mucilaginibacter sp. X4EP1 TaxID=2723092 RepID=UPI002166FC45|nr:hypothetical protein [Mucilaginibacter sp. X4EP1]MCS3815614.1 hypothetical protein [Mucilaginibacter sp. X4EP1]
MKIRNLAIIFLMACTLQTINVKADSLAHDNTGLQLPPPPRRPPPPPSLHIKNPFRHHRHHRSTHHGVAIHLPPHPKTPPPPPRP